MATIERSEAPSLALPADLTPREARANLTWVSAAHAVIHATSVLMPLVYPIIKKEYHFSYTEIGLLVSIPSLISGMLQLVFGYLGRWVTRKAMIGVGNLIVALGIVLTGLATSFGLFIGWGVVRSVGGAPQHPVGSSLLSDTYARNRRGFALAAHVAGGNIGTLAVPALGLFLITHFSWRPAVMLFALPGLIAGTGVLLFVREPTIGSQRRAPVTKPATVGTSSPLAEAATPSGPAPSRFQSLIAPLRQRGVVLIIVASMVAAGGRGLGVLTTYLPLYMTNQLHFDGRTETVLFTVLLAGSVIGPLAAGRLSDGMG
ncbi:MAG: MFS transporter, partial [Ktedonobacterales bacterium]